MAKLEEYLTQFGVSWRVVPRDRRILLARQWEAIYGSVLTLGMRHKHGQRARAEYAKQAEQHFLIVPFLGDHPGSHSISKASAPAEAFQCHSQALPVLSGFADIGFFVVPPDLSWTMVHTHEDDSLGGPYFIRQEWLVPPRPFRNPRNG